MNKWKDINSAPRDGREIIGIFARRWDFETKPTIYGPWTIAWNGRKWRSSWDESEVVNYMSDFGTEYKEPDIEPTHWQDMPAKPDVGDIPIWQPESTPKPNKPQ